MVVVAHQLVSQVHQLLMEEAEVQVVDLEAAAVVEVVAATEV
jgi:uncharacterized protein (DUF2164 family)